MRFCFCFLSYRRRCRLLFFPPSLPLFTFRIDLFLYALFVRRASYELGKVDGFGVVAVGWWLPLLTVVDVVVIVDVVDV